LCGVIVLNENTVAQSGETMMHRRIRTTATAAAVAAAALGTTLAAAGSAQAVQASWHSCTAIVAGAGGSVSASYCEGGGSGYGFISEPNSSGTIVKEYACKSFSSSGEPNQNVIVYWQVIGYDCTETI
jgi:hypothetical protein